MLQNPLINEKLLKKTEDNAVMRKFIKDLIDKENQGGQYTKHYEKLIKKYAEEVE